MISNRGRHLKLQKFEMVSTIDYMAGFHDRQTVVPGKVSPRREFATNCKIARLYQRSVEFCPDRERQCPVLKLLLKIAVFFRKTHARLDLAMRVVHHRLYVLAGL